VREEFGKSGYAALLAAGAVMTGGSMLLPGAVDLAERVLEMPARLGVPTHIRGLVDVISSPVYATGVGLVLNGMARQDRGPFGIRDHSLLAKFRHRMAYWLDEFF
jgi:cell division protein FtsA